MDGKRRVRPPPSIFRFVRRADPCRVFAVQSFVRTSNAAAAIGRISRVREAVAVVPKIRRGRRAPRVQRLTIRMSASHGRRMSRDD